MRPNPNQVKVAGLHPSLAGIAPAGDYHPLGEEAGAVRPLRPQQVTMWVRVGADRSYSFKLVLL